MWFNNFNLSISTIFSTTKLYSLSFVNSILDRKTNKQKWKKIPHTEKIHPYGRNAWKMNMPDFKRKKIPVNGMMYVWHGQKTVRECKILKQISELSYLLIQNFICCRWNETQVNLVIVVPRLNAIITGFVNLIAWIPFSVSGFKNPPILLRSVQKCDSPIILEPINSNS